MDSLQIALSMVPGDGLGIALDITEEQVRPKDVESPSVGSLHLSGDVQLIDTEVLVQGDLTGTVWGTCDRCLEPAEATIEVDINWLFVPGSEPNPYDTDPVEDIDEAEDSAEIAGTYSGDVVNLAPRVWEEVVLAVPAKVLCRPDCAGLCPWCGVNLNEKTCACAAQHAHDDDTANTGLKKLGDLFPHLKPNRPED